MFLSRRDALNLLSFLLVVSLCLAVALYAGLRIAGLDGLLGSGRPGLAADRASARQLPPGAPAEGQHLALQPDQPGIVNHGGRERPLVALTFDAELTPQMRRELDRGTAPRYVNDAVIAELRSLHVPATFFMSGLWMEQYPDVARDIGGDPLFEVGSGSYGHLAFRAGCPGLLSLDIARVTDDLDRNQTLLNGVSPHPTGYFRFPGGCFDATAIATVQAAGLTPVQYDVVAGDTTTENVDTIVAQTVSSARNGSIIVLHVTGGNSAPMTDRALPAIVSQLHFRGFTLVKISDLLAGPR